MTISELKRRLELFLTEQPVEHFKVSGSSGTGFRVELVLKPNTPLTERFIRELETALRREIGSLSVFRVRRNHVIVRFTLPPTYDEDSPETDRFEECPTRYCVSQRSLSTMGEMVTSECAPVQAQSLAKEPVRFSAKRLENLAQEPVGCTFPVSVFSGKVHSLNNPDDWFDTGLAA